MEEISPITEKAEREFLHALANKITIAKGMTEIVKSKIMNNSELADELNKLERAILAMTNMTELIVKRREVIINHFQADIKPFNS